MAWRFSVCRLIGVVAATVITPDKRSSRRLGGVDLRRVSSRDRKAVHGISVVRTEPGEQIHSTKPFRAATRIPPIVLIGTGINIFNGSRI